MEDSQDHPWHPEIRADRFFPNSRSCEVKNPLALFLLVAFFLLYLAFLLLEHAVT